MVTVLVADELDVVHERIAGRFARAEPRARVRRYVSGLVAGLERKNGWTLAEHAGDLSPDGMQRLLRRCSCASSRLVCVRHPPRRAWYSCS